MLNKNDPLVSAIQDVMRKNQAERDTVKAVNEKFGVQDRRVLPREKQGEWDAAYKSVLTEGLHPNQQPLDVHEPKKDKLTKKDFEMLRAKKKPMEEEGDPSKAIPGDTVTGSGTVTTVKPKPTSITPKQQDALKKKIETIKEAKKAAIYEGGMEKTMGEFKRGTLHSGSKTGPIVKSRKQAIAIGMNNEETVNRAGKGNLPAGVSASPKPQTVAPGKGDLPSGPARTNPGISSLNSPKPAASGSTPAAGPNRGLGPKPAAPGSAPAAGPNRGLGPKPAAPGSPGSTPVAGPNRGLGPKPAAPGSAPAAKAPDSTQKSTTTNPVAKKIIKPVRKQPPAGAAQRPGAATRPVSKYSTINKMRRERQSNKNNDPVGPGN